MQTTGRTFKITPSVKREIVKIVDERVREAHVTKEDFSELKSIVKELAEAQKRTEVKVEELAGAQKRTEIEIQKLSKGLDETRGEVGGLSRSMGYAFENEAYRSLPAVLKEKYGIEVKERIIRAEIGGGEINIFCKAERDGKEVFVIGEAKLRLDERRERKKGAGDVFEELDEKARSVENEYGKIEIVRLLITHYATKGFLKKAEEKGIIVVQSFEW